MITSILLVSILTVADLNYVEPEQHQHRIQFQFTRIPGTCNWTFRIGINGGEFEPEQPFPAEITCQPLELKLDKLPNTLK